jgi:L-ascorbate metabolism protein UlaG (beta-lactamase superfamily)
MKLLLLAASALFLTVMTKSGHPSQLFDTAVGPVKITPIYHASLMIEAGGKVIYVDPAKPAKIAGLPKADLILLTDIHRDHLDPDLIAALRQGGTEIWAPSAVNATLKASTVISNGETKTWGAWSIEAVPMYNLVRGPEPGKLYHEKGRGNGYVLSYGGKRFYLSGDTERIPELRALKNIDVAFLCMNLPYTMPPDEAALAAKDFHPKVVIPYHYGKSDLSVFQKALAGSGIEVRLLDWYPE